MTEPAQGSSTMASAAWLDLVSHAGQTAGFLPADATVAGAETVSALRRSGRRATDDDVVFAALVESEGRLHWSWNADRSYDALRISQPAARTPVSRVLAEQKFRKLSAADAPAFVARLDEQFCPTPGLFSWSGRGLRSARPVSAEPCLVYVHDMFGGGAEAPFVTDPEGVGKWADQRYSRVLSFAHPTLGASPLHSAVDLAAALRGCTGSVDVIGLGRGALVARWWRELLAAPTQRGRLVLAGAPLDGAVAFTPGRLRGTLDQISNLARGALPTHLLGRWMTGVAGLIRLMASGCGTPSRGGEFSNLYQHAPGLAAQARIRHNPELIRLQRLPAEPLQHYSFIRSSTHRCSAQNGEFPASEDGDMLVEIASTTRIPSSPAISPGQILHFSPSDGVHHWNYFEHPDMAAFLSRRLADEA